MDILLLPLAACLVLTAMHVYLGFHVLARGVIFVDLALAQVAALGLTVAVLAGHPPASDAAYWYALAFALGGAVLLAMLRTREPLVPQEAVIGIVYAVSAALAVLVLDRAPQGAEQIKQLLVGSILSVGAADVAALAMLYGVIGVLHFLVRRPLFALSLDPTALGPRTLAWDLFFFASFAVVVTSSVRIAGVLLVFCYLVVPSAIGVLLARGIRTRLAIGWLAGAAASAAGLAASWSWDLPTGAAVVTALGVALMLVALGLGLARARRALRERGMGALLPAAMGVALAAFVCGVLLAAFPRMDHLWLDAIERAIPPINEVFLTSAELEARVDALDSITRGRAELERLRRVQDDVRWGRQAMDEEQQERVRQYVAGRGEIVAGDELLLRELRLAVRERQRYAIGLPLALLGAAALAWAARARLRAK